MPSGIRRLPGPADPAQAALSRPIFSRRAARERGKNEVREDNNEKFQPEAKNVSCVWANKSRDEKKNCRCAKNDDKDRASNRSLDRIAPRMSFEDSRTKQKKGQGKSVTTKIVAWAQKRRQG